MHPLGTERAAKRLGNATQAPISCPQRCASGELHRCEQVHIHIPDALAVQGSALDEVQRFGIGRYDCRRKIGEQREHRGAMTQVAARQFTKDEWVHQHRTAFKFLLEVLDAGSEVVNPHRCVDEDHDGRVDRRRRVDFSAGSDPPSRASLRALSRSMKALRPSPMSVVRSIGPANRAARSSSSSSMLIVVRTSIPPSLASRLASSDVPSGAPKSRVRSAGDGRRCRCPLVAATLLEVRQDRLEVRQDRCGQSDSEGSGRHYPQDAGGHGLCCPRPPGTSLDQGNGG